MKMKKIYQYNSTASIWTDEYQFALRIKSKAADHDRHDKHSYFPTFQFCLEELYAHTLKQNLIDARTKDLQELISIVKTTYADLQNQISILASDQSLGNGKSWETIPRSHNNPKPCIDLKA